MGEDGVNGFHGTDGEDGADGLHGNDGKDGADGLHGNDGKDGADGLHGKDGNDGKQGEQGDLLSCTVACSATGQECDLNAIVDALPLVKCKEIIESLGKTLQQGKHYGTHQLSKSGCTYHPASNGWYQVFDNGGTSCDAPANSDKRWNGDRQRVCACL